MALEDFTTYDETDEDGDITVSANNIDVSSMQRIADSHVSSDKGVDHFNGDFEFIEEVIIASATALSAEIEFCGVANSQESLIDIFNASGNLQTAQVLNSGSETVPSFAAIEIDAGDFENGSQINASEDTQYYCEFERDESVGSFGDLEIRVYDDVGRTSLVGTSTQTLRTAKRDFRYVYALQSKNSGTSAMVWTGDVDNLDLQEAVSATQDRDGRRTGIGGGYGGRR